ncbi:hypothetical protein L0Y65_06480, partial [Candidatus Micrarchaeota archaeon]|nr:hypothetical protein [Candidatus Micrarchaeota archaeon]
MRREIFVLALLLVAFSSVVEAKDAVMAYRSDTDGTLCTGSNATWCPRIRFWNSSGSGSWGPEIELPSSGAMIQHVIIRSSPAINKLVVISLGSDDSLDAFVCTINCTATQYWTVYNDIGTAEAVDATRRFDFQYEEGTGDLILVYSVASTNGSRDLAYKILPNAQVNLSGLTEQYIDDAGDGGNVRYSWVELDRKKANASEELALIAMDSTNDHVNSWIWNGSAFGNMTEISSDVSRAGTPDRREAIAVKYMYGTGRAMAIAGYGNNGNVNYQVWNGSAWSVPSSFDIDSGSNTDLFWASMKADPNSDYLLTALIESNPNGLHTAFWNGSAWNVTSNVGTSLDGGGSTRPTDLEWNQNSTGLLVWGDGAGQVLWRECTPQCTGTTYTDTNYSSNTRFIGMARNPDQTDYVKILGVRINNNANGPIGSFSWNDTNISNYGDSVITPSSSAQNVEIAFSIEPSAFLDAQPPVVTLVSPANNSVFTQQDINFTFNVTDDKSLTLNCSIYLDGASNQSNASVLNGTNTDFSISGISGGQHSWLVSCNDTAGNPANSTTWYFYVDSAPVVTLNAPGNSSFVNSSAVAFNFTATDNNATTMNCSLFVDGAFNQSNSSVSNGTPSVISVSGLSQALHNWSVACTDNNNLTGFSATWYFTVDSTFPVVAIVNPTNSTYNTSTVPLDFTVVEANNPTCWYSLDGGANTSLPGCANTSLSSLAEGGHSVTVYANDSAGNLASDTEYFTVDT